MLDDTKARIAFACAGKSNAIRMRVMRKWHQAIRTRNSKLEETLFDHLWPGVSEFIRAPSDMTEFIQRDWGHVG